MREFIFLLILAGFASAQNTPTPNLGLNRPARGVLPWDVLINENFSVLDQIFALATCGDSAHAVSWDATTKTLGCVAIAGGGGGSGTVTNFSSGNLSPLFTTSETNTTSTPALSFILSTAGTHTFFGNNTGSTALPGFQAINQADVTSLVTDLAAKQANAEKGLANGYAALDSTGHIPLAQIPSGITGTLQYQGVWNASTNSPTLTSGVGTAGFFYLVQTAGSTNLDGHSSWNVGDMVLFNGTTWGFISNSSAVTSVAGRTGAIVLTEADIASLTADLALKANLASPTFSGTVTLPANQSLNTPTIASFANAVHTHTSAAAGGTLGVAAHSASGTPSASTFLRGDNTWAAPSGSGDALTSNPLSQFAATTSAQLAATLSNETGTNLSVFNTSPTLVTPVLGDASATSVTTTGANGGIDYTEGTGAALTLAANHDLIWGDSTAHRLKMNNNNGTSQMLPGVATAGTSGNRVVFAANGIDLVDGGVPGGGTVTAGATNTIPKYTASTTLDDSLLSDNAATLTYAGNAIAAPEFIGTSSGVAGKIYFLAGTDPGIRTNYIGLVAPLSGITAYNWSPPPVKGSAGFMKFIDPGGSGKLTSVFSGVAVADLTATGTANSTTFLRGDNSWAAIPGVGTNCSAVGTSASPSVVSCSTANAGAFSCATAASTATCTVNTTAVTTNSDIHVTSTASAGTRLGVTCNTTADAPTKPRIAAIVNGVSFTINLGTVTTNPACFFYSIVN